MSKLNPLSHGNCRVCAKPLFDRPLLRYQNMPKAAQHFPTRDEIVSERGTDLTVCQCSACGLVQLNELPVFYFRDVIRAASVSQPALALKKSQFAHLVDQYNLRGGKVIEIGCGRGEFLTLWNGLGVTAHGLEHSEEAVAACLANGFLVCQGYVESDATQLPDAPYDAFALLMFLEHMPDPGAALSGIRNNLAEGAIGLVEVPNFDMIVRNRVFAEFIADHLSYFTRDTLTFTLQLNGFEVIECNELRDNYVLSAVVRKRRAYDLEDFGKEQERISSELLEFINRFPGRDVATWGAGHQALAMISLAGIADRISYVVDSAPFKQGRYAPASHLPIVSPETMDASPPAAMIIMAASYSDEVAGIFRERFGDRIPFAILRESGLEIYGD